MPKTHAKSETAATLPGWPALLTKKLTSAYVGFSERWIEMKLAANEFPEPIRFSGSPRWRREDVDAWIEAQAR